MVSKYEIQICSLLGTCYYLTSSKDDYNSGISHLTISQWRITGSFTFEVFLKEWFHAKCQMNLSQSSGGGGKSAQMFLCFHYSFIWDGYLFGLVVDKTAIHRVCWADTSHLCWPKAWKHVIRHICNSARDTGLVQGLAPTQPSRGSTQVSGSCGR